MKESERVLAKKLELAQLSLELAKLVKERQQRLDEIGEYLIKIDGLIKRISIISDEIERIHAQ